MVEKSGGEALQEEGKAQKQEIVLSPEELALNNDLCAIAAFKLAQQTGKQKNLK